MIPLSADALNDDSLPWKVTVLDETGSTSDWLKQNVRTVPVNTVVFSESQTAGRGRRENRWIAPRGKDLMFSMLLRPAAGLETWPRITTLAALGLCKAIEAELPLTPRIKWPNDIFLAERKVSGLLAETVSGREGLHLVLGIGLNVNTLEFPPELAATSLLKRLEPSVLREIDRNTLARRVLACLQKEFQRIDEGYGDAVGEVRERSWLLGKPVRAVVEGHETFGRAIDLNEEGHLVLELPDGSTQVLTSAEHVRPL